MLFQEGARLYAGCAGNGGEGALSPRESRAGPEQKMYVGGLKHGPPISSCYLDH